MARLDTRNVAKKRSRSSSRDHDQELRHNLFVGTIRNFGEGVEPLGHRSKGEEFAAAMIMQRALAGEIARQQESLRRRVPQYKSEVADQSRQRLLAPTIETFEQDRRIAKLLGRAGRQAKLRCQFLAIVETQIGNKRQPPVATVQRLPIMTVFR